MTRLLIANDCPEQTVGTHAEFSQGMAVWAQRILWHIEDGDIVVLPVAPDAGYLAYIAELIGVRLESINLIVAPPGDSEHLSADRIMNSALYDAVNHALAGRRLSCILPLTPDAAVVILARALGAEQTLTGAAFASQGGGVMANSKVIFRAIAAGSGVPIPAGRVTHSVHEAENILADMLLTQQLAVIVKKDFGQGCRGNEILSAVDGVIPNGGRRGIVLADRVAIRAYIAESWQWLTNDGRHSVVFERYFPGSIAIFAEFNVSDAGVEFAGVGEMLATPIADGQVIPPVGLSPTTVAEIIAGGARISASMQTIGYRGTLSNDAIVTPDGEVFFSEYNGRITGSTHIYATVGTRIVGKAWMRKRVLLERRGWIAPSFQTAVDRLKASGLAFNPETKQGIVLTGTFFPSRQVISYTVVAEDLSAALALEAALHRVSPRAIEMTT